MRERERRTDQGAALLHRRLSRNFGRTCLAYHGDAYLARVGHVGFDLARYLAREHRRIFVGDLVRFHHHAHLASCLYGEAFVHALERLRDRLEVLQPFDVAFEHFAAGARATSS